MVDQMLPDLSLPRLSNCISSMSSCMSTRCGTILERQTGSCFSQKEETTAHLGAVLDVTRKMPNQLRWGNRVSAGKQESAAEIRSSEKIE